MLSLSSSIVSLSSPFRSILRNDFLKDAITDSDWKYNFLNCSFFLNVSYQVCRHLNLNFLFEKKTPLKTVLLSLSHYEKTDFIFELVYYSKTESDR